MKLNYKAFTLIELIITIAIIALIAAAVFVSVNPAKRIGEAKDSVRASDAVAIEKAIQKSIVENVSIPSALAALTEDTPYMIVTDGGSTSGDCNCNTTDTAIARVDIVEDFEDYVAGDVPVDESAINDDTGYYLTRKGNSFFIKSCNAYQDEYAGFSCGGTLTDARDGKTYNTVEIGTRCWMAESLNVGTRVNASASQTDNATIEKYCYDDSEANCTSLGGLYQWDETMNYTASCNGTGEAQPACTSPAQGICPSGWHIPSFYEYIALFRNVCTSGTCATDFPYSTPTTMVYMGTDEGAKLKVGGSSGMEMMLSGWRDNNQTTVFKDILGIYRSSWGSGANAGDVSIAASSNQVLKTLDPNYQGYSIRCVQD